MCFIFAVNQKSVEDKIARSRNNYFVASTVKFFIKKRKELPEVSSMKTELTQYQINSMNSKN